MKNSMFLLIISNIMLLLTAMTCQDSYWTERNLVIENQTNDTFFVAVGSGKPLTSSKAMRLYQIWGTKMQVVPNGNIIEHILDAEDRTVYCALLKKKTLAKYSEEEIIERNLIEFYSYSYQELKKMKFKIVYSDIAPTESVAWEE